MTSSHSQVSRFWADHSTAYFQALQTSGRIDQVIAVLPVAATEQHGPHLPLQVDTAIVNGVVAAALPHLERDSTALFLPTQAVGFSPEHARFPGTLTLKAETLIRLWTDIGEGVAAAGVKKMVFFNAHGGQANLMDIVARDLRARLDMLVWTAVTRSPGGGRERALYRRRTPLRHSCGRYRNINDAGAGATPGRPDKGRKLLFYFPVTGRAIRHFGQRQGGQVRLADPRLQPLRRCWKRGCCDC